MLKAPKLSNPSPSIPFLPRQIMLASAAVADEEVVLTKRKKEKKEKKRKEKNSSGTLELDIVVADGVSKKGQCRDALLRSIAAFLETNEFPRTLSTLQSEAGIEFNNEKTSAVNLEDLLCKFLETSNDPAEKAAIGWIQDQDLVKSNASMEAVEKNVNNIAEQYPKKKRKNTDQSGKNKLEEGCPQSVNLGEITDEASDDFQVKDSTNLRENGDIKKLKPSSNLDADTKEKKRKKKSASESLTENSDVKQLDGTVGISDSADLNLGNPCESKKENKKRKHKKSSDVPTENAEIDDHGKLKELQSVTDGSSERKDKIEKKKEKKAKDVQPEVSASTTENNTNDKLVEAEKSTLSAVERPLNDKDSKRKEKKKKHKLTPEGLMEPEKSFDANKGDTQQDVQGSDLANTVTLATVDTDAKVGKKSSKKRKRAASEEERDNTQTDNSQIVNMKTDETNADTEQHVLTKKMKKEEGNESENLSLLTNAEKEVCEQMANGGVVDDKEEAGNLSKETKKDKKSKEPKSITPFQRVKIDEVKFADHRLKDNSYWAKGGADSGYGARAQEVLGQVRGRDFRHEKTKKKRGTYRGGLIDLQSHSIKFTYSDEE